ncbi:RDD family protein [Rathayibacter sp. VKM Ac-2927]|uniref:RDD family protein n=1 Tax=Rathayibacter sp. VKM Ac-2927 TaxID=2929478 RepID=UPI001FB3BE0A|nr:RDD family protein [Rathayibacter sp. VKM Ac-2927]MCJ1687397.1 DUF3500 domain-containing protein [Rathayibacter sp. VKM Ac-2927]
MKATIGTATGLGYDEVQQHLNADDYLADNGGGDDWAFPPTKEGLQVSSLSADQKSLVLAAIASYVDDIADADATTILANTAGALLGTVLAPVLVLLTGRRTERDAEQPRPVTLRRRLFGMLCDALVLTLVSGALASVTALGLALLEPGVPPGLAPLVLGVLAFVAPALQLVLVLRTGRTIGEAVVRLTPSTTPALWQRLVRWALGSGGWAAALASPLPGSGSGATLLVLAALVGVLATRDRRGFASAVARLRVIDDRAAPAEDAVDAIDSP